MKNWYLLGELFPSDAASLFRLNGAYIKKCDEFGVYWKEDANALLGLVAEEFSPLKSMPASTDLVQFICSKVRKAQDCVRAMTRLTEGYPDLGREIYNTRYSLCCASIKNRWKDLWNSTGPEAIARREAYESLKEKLESLRQRYSEFIIQETAWEEVKADVTELIVNTPKILFLRRLQGYLDMKISALERHRTKSEEVLRSLTENEVISVEESCAALQFFFEEGMMEKSKLMRELARFQLDLVQGPLSKFSTEKVIEAVKKEMEKATSRRMEYSHAKGNAQEKIRSIKEDWFKLLSRSSEISPLVPDCILDETTLGQLPTGAESRLT